MPTWNAEINIEHTGDESTAEARLIGKGPGPLIGKGTAHRNPADENVPAIGDELAVARALSDLAHQLLHTAVMDIEAHTHERVERLRS
ncbi:DUF1876 domain-containing protein [Streptomyces sannanensis]|uniref:DUF1876 domain-containing protein n=1 Tax=Streptomyces sannanensis TaxID=285536 RepID=A0ABP6SEG7_9ACTN